MSDKNNSTSQNRIAERKDHGKQLRSQEAALHKSAADQNRQQFFEQITPLLGSLKHYIARRLRIAYLNLDLRTESVYTEDDIVDEAVLTAYQNFDKKPKDLSLEQWLYRLANQKLENYLKRAAPRDAKRRSLESLTEKEERTLEEQMTADAEGEPMLVEDLYDNEYHLQPEFTPPAYQGDPSELVEKNEEVQEILRALSRIPQRDLMLFELSAIEGFSNDEVAKIAGVPADEVEKVVKKVRSQVLQQLSGAARRRAS
jgi:RNA polymerase sigma factor (sigma-70 family)